MSRKRELRCDECEAHVSPLKLEAGRWLCSSCRTDTAVMVEPGEDEWAAELGADIGTVHEPLEIVDELHRHDAGELKAWAERHG